MKLQLLILFAAGLAAFGQTPQPPSFLSDLTSSKTLVMASMVASQMAAAKTDWHYTIAGKAYSVTPAQRLGLAGGIFGASVALERVWPKSRKGVRIAGILISGYFAGRALANSYGHGQADPLTPK